MALEEPNTATSVYKQYLIWKIATLRLGVPDTAERYQKDKDGNLQFCENEAYYQRLLREHNLRWKAFKT